MNMLASEKKRPQKIRPAYMFGKCKSFLGAKKCILFLSGCVWGNGICASGVKAEFKILESVFG